MAQLVTESYKTCKTYGYLTKTYEIVLNPTSFTSFTCSCDKFYNQFQQVPQVLHSCLYDTTNAQAQGSRPPMLPHIDVAIAQQQQQQQQQQQVQRLGQKCCITIVTSIAHVQADPFAADPATSARIVWPSDIPSFPHPVSILILLSATLLSSLLYVSDFFDMASPYMVLGITNIKNAIWT